MVQLDGFKADAGGFYRGTVLVADFMQDVHSNLRSRLVNLTSRQETIRAMFLRALAWMRTLKKLDEPTDFQAAASCSRGLLEIAVDMILLHQDKGDESCTKMRWWEQSAKLKAAEALVKCYSDRGLPVPDEFAVQKNFIKDNKKTIQQQRRMLWPHLKGKHPKNRWTGSPGLVEDVQLADGYYGRTARDELGATLTEFYQTDYRRINWDVHGSALAGIRGVSAEGFHASCALTFKRCSDLAMVCIRVIADDFDFAAYFPELSARLNDLNLQRARAYADAKGWKDGAAQDRTVE